VRRLLAVLAAAGMIAGALFVRDRIDDDGASGDGGDGEVVLVCAPELEDACRALSDDVTVEDPFDTAERLLTADRLVTADDAPFDVWVTVGPWPRMVDDLRTPEGLGPLFPDPGDVAASTPLAVVGEQSLPREWRTLGTQVGDGELRLGWTGARSGLGVMVLGALTTGYFGDVDVATNDLDLDPGFDRFLDAFIEEAEVAADPVERLLQSRAFFDAAVSLAVDAEDELEGAGPGRREGLEPFYPEIVVSLEAVLGGPQPVVEELTDELTDELLADGWDGEVGQGLPAVLAALWDRVR